MTVAARLSALLLGLMLTVWTAPLGVSQTQPQPPKDIQNENVRNTRHNLSATPPDVGARDPGFPDRPLERRVFTQQTTEICVFCHTPHVSVPEALAIQAPIWNRSLSTANYQLYDQTWSFSFRGQMNPGAPTGYSRLCLACHDGTIALGRVINAPGTGPAGTGVAPFLSPPFEMTYPDPAQVPAGTGAIPRGTGAGEAPEFTGDTRLLGTNLTNDHAISFVFDSALAALDKELVDPGPPLSPPQNVKSDPKISPMRRYPGTDLGTFDAVQCTSCHNPHTVEYPKFLRANWLDRTPERKDEKIICLFCHEKPGFKDSTHAISTLIRAEYPTAADNPKNPGYDFDGKHTVAEYSCRNCHDPHALQGSKRLHRDGADAASLTAQDAIELTCYLCHSPPNGGIRLPAGTTSNPLFTGSGTEGTTAAPDILTEFAKNIEPISVEGPGRQQALPAMSNLEVLARSASRPGGPTVNTSQAQQTGSAMSLRFATGHQPEFVSTPAEGIELLSPSPKAGNRGASIPGTDTAHVECTDCHNPHRVRPRDRFNGMHGIDIKGNPVGVYLTSPLARPSCTGDDLDPPCRGVVIHEVCFRCHGNSYTNHVPEVTIAATGRTGNTVVQRGNNPCSLGPCPGAGVSNPPGTPVGGSNKRKEFDPDSKPADVPGITAAVGSGLDDPSIIGINTSFHPVATTGRNQSGVLDNTNAPVRGQLLGLLSREKTITCVDCHNTDVFAFPQPGTFDIIGNALRPRFPGPITGRNDGTSYRRVTDLPSSLPLNIENDPTRPQGPHGSVWKRILRANYDTTLGTADCRPDGTAGADGGGACVAASSMQEPYNRENFALCFQCHDEAAFTTQTFNPIRTRLTNFVRGTVNLHWLHIVGDPGAPARSKGTRARCHECHYNVHSNIEAGNTVYRDLTGFSAGGGGHDKSTHLINFQPKIGAGSVGGTGSPPTPQWGLGVNSDNAASNTPVAESACEPSCFSPVTSGASFEGPGCNLKCHGLVMNHNYNEHSAINGER